MLSSSRKAFGAGVESRGDSPSWRNLNNGVEQDRQIGRRSFCQPLALSYSATKTKRKEAKVARESNTKTSGGSFSKATIRAVWKKAIVDPGYTIFKKDRCGATIKRDDYGKTQIYGWEIDHIKPVAKGGTDDLGNLEPLHWENNRHKADDYPDWSCERKS
jgi:hypothetical protein